eukprot:gnl/MRDRNA2_/MRDRNA2_79516_c0_seq1.p1 gnl/MRDRNA2_/MRDRNA2_79516_c0~~gnl/MRDRNA2_/MRDRNA2_79516_c0_seq1.p1  ORF type:complete len:363 (+),score=36.57 gnl/MRDRNA2_/MRDRNA2_79516_c0_seq1:479-1567(+)
MQRQDTMPISEVTSASLIPFTKRKSSKGESKTETARVRVITGTIMGTTSIQVCAGNSDVYKVIEVLGKGEFATVTLSEHYRDAVVPTGMQFAVKALQCIRMCNPSDAQLFENNCTNLKTLRHPNVVRLVDTFISEQEYHLVMELCIGGDLYSMIENANARSRRAASRGQFELASYAIAGYLWQMLSGIAYLHQHQFAHRDVKAENYMLKTQSSDSPIKLIDFGLLCHFEKKGHMSEVVGTAYCVAPEVLQGSYNEKCDVWSIGVTGYYMCVGHPPFVGSSDKHTLQQIRNAEILFSDDGWSRHPSQLTDLIKELLNRDQQVRPHAQAVLAQNFWLMNCRPRDSEPKKEGVKVGCGGRMPLLP